LDILLQLLYICLSFDQSNINDEVAWILPPCRFHIAATWRRNPFDVNKSFRGESLTDTWQRLLHLCRSGESLPYSQMGSKKTQTPFKKWKKYNVEVQNSSSLLSLLLILSTIILNRSKLFINDDILKRIYHSFLLFSVSTFIAAGKKKKKLCCKNEKH